MKVNQNIQVFNGEKEMFLQDGISNIIVSIFNGQKIDKDFLVKQRGILSLESHTKRGILSLESHTKHFW